MHPPHAPGLTVFRAPGGAADGGAAQAFRAYRGDPDDARIDRFGFPGAYEAWLTQCSLDPRLALAAAEAVAPLCPDRPAAETLLGGDREQRLLAALAERCDCGDGLLRGAAQVLRGSLPPGPVAARLLGPGRWWPVLIDLGGHPRGAVVGRLAEEVEPWVSAYPGLQLGIAVSDAVLRQLREERDDRRGLCLLRSAAMPLAATPGGSDSSSARVRPPRSAPDPAAARSQAEALLYEWLERLPATRGRFRLNARLKAHFGPGPAEIDLYAPGSGLAVEIDGHWHFQDANAWRRDRRKDLFLQQQGLLVHRVLADDVAADPRSVALHLAHLCALRGESSP